MVKLENIFATPMPEEGKEIIKEVMSSPHTRVEIIASGENDSLGEWYDQDENELVMVVTGSSKLRFGDGSVLEMRRGDYINIPAHLKHRVERTKETLWLAIFYK